MWLDSKAVNCPQKWGNFILCAPEPRPGRYPKPSHPRSGTGSLIWSLMKPSGPLSVQDVGSGDLQLPSSRRRIHQVYAL